MNAEQNRLQQSGWRKWGPYLSERQWGTVREDYSEHGEAWNYFPHEHARSRVYRWGEDGIAGISDDQQHICFAVALWNGKDQILNTGLFGEGKYFDVFTEYAKNDTEDLLIRITIHNRGNELAYISVLPTIWFRNLWSFGMMKEKPLMYLKDQSGDFAELKVDH